MSQNVLFNEISQKSNFENRSNNFTLPVLTSLNKENLTHSADSLYLMFSDSDQSSKNSNADLDFEALISTSQYIDISKLDDFVTDETPEGKLLALELNMRSLVNNSNFSKLEALLSFMTYKPDIISISETWITPLSSDAFLYLPGYKCAHNSRFHFKGGAVALYVKDTIRFHVLTELTTMHEKLIKSIFIKLELQNESIIYGTIYWSPSHNTGSNQIFFDNLKETLESIKSNHKCLIFGDLNYNLLQHDNNMVR